MDLVDEQHVAGFQVGQQSGQVARPLEDRTRSTLDRHAHFFGNDVRQGGLAQPGRTEDQSMVERFLAPFRGADE